MKKVVKGSLTALILTSIFAVCNVSAITVALNGLAIPALMRSYITSTRTKYNYSPQYVTKVTATDNLSGDERAMQARVINGPAGYSDYKDLPKGRSVSLGNSATSNTVGNYQLEIRASKLFATGAKFYGSWNIN